MTPIFTSKTALRGTVIFSTLTALYAVSGCGTESTETAAAGGGGADAGIFAGSGGASTQGGATGSGGEGAGGMNGGGSGGEAPGVGGLGGLGATGGVGGGTGGDAAGDAAVACVVPDPASFVPTAGLKDCPTADIGLPNCMNGKCIPAALVPADSRDTLSDCAADKKEKCVPTYFIERQKKFLPPVCKSLKDAEGRCLSQCIPQIAQQETFLPKGVCATGDLCAPCYDPRTGKDTGACSLGCDKGPTKPAILFDRCCKGTGFCVPKEAIPAASVDVLGADSCKASGELCAPEKLMDPGAKPKACTSLKGAEGRCLPDCLPDVAKQAGRLAKDSCDTGELCAPCYDPISGASTGACNQNGDTPSKPKVLFDVCCGALGHCVPGTVLTADQSKLLAADTCATSGELCAPDVLSVAGAKADTCRALGSLNAEGRCLPACLPTIQSQKDRLDQGTPKSCAEGTLCVPCYDPLSGAASGACNQNGDGPKEAAKLFPSCCGGLGSCVTPALVPVDQQVQLGHDTCGAPADLLCAPKALGDPTMKPKTCRAPGDIEARCLPACLPPIAAQAKNLRQQTCATGELCADCYSPIDGTDTNACRINGDVPAEAKKVFASCAAGLGLCVPKALVPAGQQASLPPSTCTGADTPLCAPAAKVKDPAFKFPSCAPQVAVGPVVFPPDPSQPAACLPKYIVDFQAAQPGSSAGLLQQSDCLTGSICVPCEAGGTSTGACD